MNIYTESGSKVIYLGTGGYDSDLIHANKYLKVGEIYTVEWVDVGDWSSDVYLEEVPGQDFNTVHFENVEVSTIIEDQLKSHVTPEIERIVDLEADFLDVMEVHHSSWLNELTHIVRKRGGISKLRLKDLVKIEQIVGYRFIKIEKL